MLEKFQRGETFDETLEISCGVRVFFFLPTEKILKFYPLGCLLDHLYQNRCRAFGPHAFRFYCEVFRAQWLVRCAMAHEAFDEHAVDLDMQALDRDEEGAEDSLALVRSKMTYVRYITLTCVLSSTIDSSDSF